MYGHLLPLIDEIDDRELYDAVEQIYLASCVPLKKSDSSSTNGKTGVPDFDCLSSSLRDIDYIANTMKNSHG